MQTGDLTVIELSKNKKMMVGLTLLALVIVVFAWQTFQPPALPYAGQRSAGHNELAGLQRQSRAVGVRVSL